MASPRISKFLTGKELDSGFSSSSSSIAPLGCMLPESSKEKSAVKSSKGLPAAVSGAGEGRYAERVVVGVDGADRSDGTSGKPGIRKVAWDESVRTVGVVEEAWDIGTIGFRGMALLPNKLSPSSS